MKQVKENLVKNINWARHPLSWRMAWDRDLVGGLVVAKYSYGLFQPWVDDSQEEGCCSGV